MVTAMERELPSTVKVVTVWLLAGIAVFLAIQWWQHRAQQARFQLPDSGSIEIRRGPDGHYHWPGRINGREVEFLIDTGATGSAIPTALARELQLASLGEVSSNTAGGVVAGQLVRIDLQLRGGVQVDKLPVVALPALGDQPLLGMDVLGKLHWQQRDGVLRVELEAQP
ncbi:MAG TPA: retropepsin-like aspartic protease [Burkholderiaceae bacterium]|nr:retropepsin-like aspartic protease [Burkholderiaceae bacterium]